MTCSRAAAEEAGTEAVGLLPLTAEEISLMAPFTIPLSAFIAMVSCFVRFFTCGRQLLQCPES